MKPDGIWRLGVVLAASLGLVGSPDVGAQERIYPRINLSSIYAVDPAWPKCPAGMSWGAVSGVAVDGHNQVWVFHRGEPSVHVYKISGQFVTAWSGGIGDNSSHQIRIDGEGNVWTTDIVDHVVRKFTPRGDLLLTLGTKGHSGRDLKHFNMPTDVAVTATGDVYVTDGYGNNRVVQFTKEGAYVREWGELGSKPGQFSIPHAIAADSRGRLYVADRNNARIQVFDPSGKYLAEWRNLCVPWGISVTKNDEIWVCGSSPMQWRPEDKGLGVPPKDQLFLRFDPEGKVLQIVTVPKGVDGLERPGECNWVHAIAEDGEGNLYVGDIMGKRAQKFVKRAGHRD